MEYAEGFIKMFSCICPHVGEEIWEVLGHKDTIAFEKWPSYDADTIREDFITIGIQVNGKVKGVIELSVEEERDSAIAKAKDIFAVKKAIEGKAIKREVYVKGKIINIVAEE